MLTYSSQKVRDFNVNEYSSWLINQSAPHNGVISVTLNSKIDVGALERRVRSLCLSEPMLRLTTYREQVGFFACEERVPFHVYKLEGSDWQIVASREINTRFDCGKALAKFSVYQCSDGRSIVIFTFSHVISDALSAIHFHLRLIQGDVCVDVKMLYPDYLNLYPGCLGKTPIKEKNITTSLKGIKITGDDMLQVARNLSLYNCSLNTYISACSIIAAMTIFDLSAINVSTSVDLRRIKGCDQTMCFFTSWLSFDALREQADSLTTMIDKVRNEIKHQMINKTYMKNLYHLNDRIRSSTDGEHFVNSFISSRPTLFISNCGNSEKLKTKDASELLELHACATSHSYMGTKDSFTLQVFVIDDEAIFIDLSLPPMANSASYDAFLQQLKGAVISP
jgi:hypothetical protein